MGKEKRWFSNTGVFFLIAAMFLVLGFLVNRGLMAIGFIFLLIALTSIGRPRIRFYDEEDEGDEGEAENDSG